MGTVDVKVSSGQLDVSKEKNLLVWSLGKHCAPAQKWKKRTKKKWHRELKTNFIDLRPKVSEIS